MEGDRGVGHLQLVVSARRSAAAGERCLRRPPIRGRYIFVFARVRRESCLDLGLASFEKMGEIHLTLEPSVNPYMHVYTTPTGCGVSRNFHVIMRRQCGMSSCINPNADRARNFLGTFRGNLWECPDATSWCRLSYQHFFLLSKLDQVVKHFCCCMWRGDARIRPFAWGSSERPIFFLLGVVNKDAYRNLFCLRTCCETCLAKSIFFFRL